MSRYIISNRRSGKFQETEKRASREALSAALETLTDGADIVRDNSPVDDLSRRSVMMDVSPEEINALRATVSDEVIIEPEILHYPTTNVPIDLLDEFDSAGRFGDSC